jgi:hypothetical protein
MAYGSIATRVRVFGPHLAGTNSIESTLKDFTHYGPILNKYLMGFSLAISTFQGLVGDEPVSRRKALEDTTDRVVQIHFDWFSKAGLFHYLNRSVIAGDENEVPILNRELYDKMIERDIPKEYTFPEVVPNITLPGNSVTQAHRYDPAGDNTGWGHIVTVCCSLTTPMPCHG